MAEYAHAYGGPPAATLKWPLFLSLCRSSYRFWARRELTQLDAVSGALAALFGGDDGSAEQNRGQLLERAYPVKKQLTQPTFIKNTLGPDAKDPTDG